MKKIILIAAGAVVLLGGGIGGTVAVLSMHHSGPAKPAPPPPPKPILFGQLNNLVVTVPADTGDSTTAYVQITLQFATTDPNAVTSFTSLEPIITSKVIALLMTKTAKSLMDPTTHDALAAATLAIANQVLNQQAAYKPANPFTAGYITNIVEQN